jgi:hypothetical protein
MGKVNVPPEGHAPCTPGKSPSQKSVPIPILEDKMKQLSVCESSLFVPFNFFQRCIMLSCQTGYHKSGISNVMIVYLVNTARVDNFNAIVSKDGTKLKFQVKIPKMFLDIVARAYTKFDTSYAPTHVIVSALCATTNAIVQAIGPDFDNVWTNGQNDPLSFSCCANPHIQLLWHEGNDKLRTRLENNNNIGRDTKHQMLAIVRATLKAQVKERMGTVRIEDAVLCRHSGSSGVKDSTLPLPPGCPFSSYLWEAGGFLSMEGACKKHGEDKDFDSGSRCAQPCREHHKCKSPLHYNKVGGMDRFNE